MVRLDAATNRLYFVNGNGRTITVGHLDPESERRVVLNKDVGFSAHRQNGVIVGVINSVGNPVR